MAPPEETPPHMLGPPVEFAAKGGSEESENQANLIQARQSMGIVPAKEVFADAMLRRANRDSVGLHTRVRCGPIRD